MPILSAHALEFISRSAAQTRRVGMRLGALIKPGDVICLQGDLGAGKTTLMQGVAAGWGSLDPVSSPTFMLVNMYRRPDGKRLFHLDAYRLSTTQEAIELDLDEMIESAPLVIEWAERIQSALPRENLWINLQWIDDDHRDILFSANGKRYQDLIAVFREQVYGIA